MHNSPILYLNNLRITGQKTGIDEKKSEPRKNETFYFNDCQYRTKHNNLLDAFRFNLRHHQ